jgi:hypothetical protein
MFVISRKPTKNGETVRDYYLNLEEVCFEYAEYQASWLTEKAELQRKISDEKLAKQMRMLSIKDKEIEQESVARQKAEQDKEQESVARQKAEQDKEKAEHDKEKAKFDINFIFP